MSTTVEQMFTTLTTHFEKLDHKIEKIDDRLNAIIRIEERQASDRTALARMGKELDRMRESNDTLEKEVSDLRLKSAVAMVKMASIGGGSGSIVTALISFAIWYLSGGSVSPDSVSP